MCAVDRPGASRVGDELNLGQMLRKRLPAHRPPFQVVLPRARIDVGDAETFGREAAREFADVKPAVDSYLRGAQAIDGALDDLLGLDSPFPPQGFWERREAARLMPALRKLQDPRTGTPENHAFRSFAGAVAHFAADAAGDTLSPTLQARLCSNWRRGTFRVPGGRAGLAEVFLDKSGGSAAEMQPTLRVGRLAIQRGKVTGVIAEGREEALGCEHLIVGTRPERLLALLGEGRPARRFAQALAATPVVGRRFTVNLILPAASLPEGMSTLVIAAEEPGDTRAPLLLMAAEPDEQERVVLTVGTQVAAQNGVSQMREAVVRRLADVVPFFDRHLLLCHSPHDGLPASGPLAADLEPPAAVEMTPIYAIHDTTHGIVGLPYKTGLKNAYYAGRASLPGLGVEGELEAAWSVARILSKKRRAPDPFRRRVLFGRPA
jgi:hypothetical protein